MLTAKNSQMGRPLTAKGFQMNLNAEADNSHLDAFLAAAHRRKYPAKSTLIYAGDKSDSIYYQNCLGRRFCRVRDSPVCIRVIELRDVDLYLRVSTAKLHDVMD